MSSPTPTGSPRTRQRGNGVRDADLADVTALLSTGHALLVLGDRGSGRSTLLDRIESAADRTRRVRTPLEAHPAPYAGLAAMIAAVGGTDPDDAGFGFLDRAAEGSAVAVATAMLLRRVHDTIAEPTILLVDDADRLDAESRAVLVTAASRLERTPLRVVATAVEPLDGLVALPTVRLAPLDRADAMGLIAELTDGVGDPAIVRILVTASAGNLAALVSSTRMLTPDQLLHATPLELPLPIPMPHGHHLERDALTIRLAFSHLHSAHAVPRELDSELERALAEGRVVREGRYVRLRDPLERVRSYRSLDLTTRRRLHAELEAAEADLAPGLARWHGSHHEPDRVADLALLESSIAFAIDGHPWQAIELAERALSVTRAERPPSGPLLEFASALLERGEPAHAERYARIAARHATARAELRRASLIRTLAAFAAADRLSPDCPEYQDSVGTHAGAEELTLIATAHLARWEHEEAGELLARAEAGLPEATPQIATLHRLALVQRAALRGEPAAFSASTPKGASRPALRPDGGESHADPLAMLSHARTLICLDHDRAARRMLRALIDLDPAPDTVTFDAARRTLIELDIRSGRHADAVALIRTAHRSARTWPDHPVERMLLAWERLADDEHGDSDAAKGMDEQLRRFLDDDAALAARFAAYRGALSLAHGRFDEAVTSLRWAVELGSRFGNPALLRLDVDVVKALLLSGRREEALDHARDFLRRTERFRTPWTLHARARIEALLEPGPDSLAMFEHAARLATSTELSYEHARTELSLAERLEALGHRHEALERRRSARAAFGQLGAVGWMHRAERDPAPDSPDAPAPGHRLLAQLSDDETRIALLVCQGLRNKEIASMLFVSSRTVELRLTGIYHRLGVSSRAQLIAALLDHGRSAVGT